MDDIAKIRIAYDICKAVRRDPATGKAYTDRDFARDYLDCNFTMVAKVLSGGAVSRPVLDAIYRFIGDTRGLVEDAVGGMMT